jgi:hypothetical protein
MDRLQEINKRQPVLKIKRVETGTNVKFRTVFFEDNSVYFPHSVYMNVCVAQ